MCDRHRFVFEFDKAFADQCIRKLKKSPAHSLAKNEAPAETGIYVLYRGRRLVYAGKALDTTPRRRLAEHAKKIASRRNITLMEMKCRYLTIESDWFVRAGEYALITTFKPAWNASGFGSHVPGRGRPGIRVSQWDKEFPPR